MGSESAGLTELAAEFPGYDFGTQPSWNGTAIIAVREDGLSRPGLCVVITADVDEMRDALLEGQGVLLEGQGVLLEGQGVARDALPGPRVGTLGEDRG